jgi:hypothetical protein
MTDAAPADAALLAQADQADAEAPPYNRHPDPAGDGSPPTAIVEPPRPRPPRVAIDWAASVVTAGLVAAIARAQSDLRPVGKSSRNEQGSGGRGYDYASADDMIGECRRAFSRQGVAIVSAHYMVDPPSEDPITVDAQGNATQWLSCVLKGETALLFTEPATREVGRLVIRWEQDAIGKRGTPPDKAQRAAETYALGFVSRGIGHMNRAVTPKDEDRDQHDDDGERAQGRRTGGQPRTRDAEPQQGSTRKVTPSQGKVTPASTGGDKFAPLRASVIERYTALGLQEWRRWGLVCKDAGLDAVVKVADATADQLRKLHDYLEAEQAKAAKAEADAASAAAEGGS